MPYGTGPFPLQGTGTALDSIGNETRLNPKVRYFPNLNENMSVARIFPIHEKSAWNFARRHSMSSTGCGSGPEARNCRVPSSAFLPERAASSTRPAIFS